MQMTQARAADEPINFRPNIANASNDRILRSSVAIPFLTFCPTPMNLAAFFEKRIRYVHTACLRVWLSTKGNREIGANGAKNHGTG